MEVQNQAVAVKDVQDVAVTEDKGVMGLTMRFLPATGAVGALAFTSAANAAEFSLDMADLLVNIGVVIAAVTAVGLASLSLALTVKSFKYVKSAF
ncbi:major capsid protein [uncultured Psychrobacter sp.]|uniref:major capsid protein n=1 Tax=uncultured Psychrobacter sp. TaxID=259303 RepID=UPI0032B25840|tara:strand:- start:8090 stop:8374 length:285 start_codon:yes stop_codon:yes gene_type:complete